MASPSKNQNYAYLSRLSTQKLLELLAAAPAPAETPEDKAYIDAIVEVVLEREERHPTGLLPDPEQAWEEFQQYYNTPEGEDLSLYPAENPGTAPSEPAPSQTEYRPQRRPKRHFFRRVVIVAHCPLRLVLRMCFRCLVRGQMKCLFLRVMVKMV